MDDLAERRKRAGLTQTALANRIGLSQSQIARIEGGASGTTQPVLEAINRAITEASKPPTPRPERQEAKAA